MRRFSVGFFPRAVSPWITGENEPWDTGWFYLICIATGGAIAGAFCTSLRAAGLPWLWAAGWFELGVITTGIGSLTGLSGLLLVVLPRRRSRR